MKILLATENPGKIEEINRLFRDTPIEFVGPGPLEERPIVVEDGQTYHENAMKKAMAYYRLTSMPTLSEDSGLEVESLGGAPGLLSARFAGDGATDEDNCRKLLDLMRDVPEERRTARFVSVFCLIIDEDIYFFEGEVRGRILKQPRGESGFGYDPVFAPEGYDRSFAELGEEVKNRISHRAAAIKRLKEFLKERFDRK